MKGIHPSLCTCEKYIEQEYRPILQPQRRMNPTSKEIVKEEIKKIISVNFIYLVSDSQWVSPIVIPPKKNGKWIICVNYGELNKATHKIHFPLPFIYQVFELLSRNKYFSFLDGFSGYNKV